MQRIQVLETLIDLLVQIEKGILGLDDPVSQMTKDGIVKAIIGFGEEARLHLHRSLELLDYLTAGGYIEEILGEVGDTTTVSYLIRVHQRGFFMNSLAALQSVVKLGEKYEIDEAYEYLYSLFLRLVEGDTKVFNSTEEGEVTFRALIHWHNPKGFEVARQVLKLDLPLLLRPILQIIKKSPEVQKIMLSKGKQDPDIERIIAKAREQFNVSGE
jgi:hypothetical protein